MKYCENYACNTQIRNEWYDKYNICPECLIRACIKELKNDR